MSESRRLRGLAHFPRGEDLPLGIWKSRSAAWLPESAEVNMLWCTMSSRAQEPRRGSFANGNGPGCRSRALSKRIRFSTCS